MILVTLVAFLVVITVVFIHYESLRAVTNLIPKAPGPPRSRLYFEIIGALIGHIIEIWVFAIAYYLLSLYESFGKLKGTFVDQFYILDYVYYSAITYTSLGSGELVTVGYIRFITAAETITGLVMIAWTASFAYFQMERLWKEDYKV